MFIISACWFVIPVHITLFHSDENLKQKIYRAKSIITLKNNVSDIYSHKYSKIKINLDYDLPLEKTEDTANVVILIKSIFNENHNYNCSEMFLKKMYEIIDYDRVDISQGIDVNKTSASNECIICHYWYFLDKKCKFQWSACNGCHDVLMLSVNLNSIAILNIHYVDCFCISAGITKSETIISLEECWFDWNEVVP